MRVMESCKKQQQSANVRKGKSILYLDQFSNSDKIEEFVPGFLLNRTYNIISHLVEKHNVTVFPLTHQGNPDGKYIEKLQQSGVEVIRPPQQLDFNSFAESRNYDIVFIGKPQNLITHREELKNFFPNAFLVYDSGHVLYGRQMPDPAVVFPTEEDKADKTCFNLVVPTEEDKDKADKTSCAVIITCHNYAKYLVESIESVLNQTVLPVDILVVDDASDDNPKGVVDNYPNVRYERVEHRCPNKSRGFGFLDVIKHNPNLAAVAFLDADNYYPESYLETGLPLLGNPLVAVVYPDLQFFENKDTLIQMPEYSWKQMLLRNIMDTSSIVKRDALEQSEFWKLEPLHIADWTMYKKVLNGRWRGAKNPTPLFYRDHNAPHRLTISRQKPKPNHYDLMGLCMEDITIFIPFSGRKEIWEKTRTFLENQSWPHSKTKIIFCDTSFDEKFGGDLKSWLFSSDYEDVHYYKQRIGTPNLADKDRRGNHNVQHNVNMAMAKIYNNLLPKVATEYLLIVEDDNIPEYDCAEKLLRSFTPGGNGCDCGCASTFSVSAPYPHRFWPKRLTMWNWKTINGVLKKEIFSSKELKSRTGSEVIGGNGFGTVMLRSSVIENYPFLAMETPNGNVEGEQFFDVALYAWLKDEKTNLGETYIAKVNWDVFSNHLVKGLEPVHDPLFPDQGSPHAISSSRPIPLI